MSYPNRPIADPVIYFLKTQPSQAYPGKTLVIMDPDGHVAHVNPDGSLGTPDAPGADGPANQCVIAGGVLATFTPNPGKVAVTYPIQQTDPA